MKIIEFSYMDSDITTLIFLCHGCIHGSVMLYILLEKNREISTLKLINIYGLGFLLMIYIYAQIKNTQVLYKNQKLIELYD